MDLNPIVLLVGGSALLIATLTVAVVNRRAIHTENPYDEPPRKSDLAEAMWAIRSGHTLYRVGMSLGRAYPAPSAERVAGSLERVGLGKFEVRRSARRVDLSVREGPMTGVPAIGEPLCYFTLGILRGALPGRVTEEACAGMGAPHCVFSVEEVRPRARAKA